MEAFDVSKNDLARAAKSTFKMLGIGGKIAVQEGVGHGKIIGKKVIDVSSSKLKELHE